MDRRIAITEKTSFRTLRENAAGNTDVEIAPDYFVRLGQGKRIVLALGFFLEHPGARFQHPNIIRSENHVFDLKKHHKGGGKSWSEKAGVVHFMSFPDDEISLIPEKGYSYVPVEIAGVRIVLNTSGGGGKEWVDWVGGSVHHALLNISLADLRKIAAVSEIPTDEIRNLLQGNSSDSDREREEKRFDAMMLKKEAKKRVPELIDKGVKLELVLSGCTVESVIPVRTVRTNGRLSCIYATYGCENYRIRLKQIDWAGTLQRFEERNRPAPQATTLEPTNATQACLPGFEENELRPTG
jgi:hypothetical protein